MASTYNPYDDIQKVYNAKVNWNNATTDSERQKQNQIATAARRNLEAYGYGDVANQISASGADATAVRKIMEQYAPVATASTNDTTEQLITKNNNEVRNKTNQLWGIQTNDREVMAGKYDKLEDTAYSNPFNTDEARAIMGKYDMSAMNARNNAVASGGASNGGNIDSYAAANAMRQQASLINQGQMAVLDAHNNKINNIKGILEGLGIYQQNQDKGMQNTILMQQNESQRLFDNSETAKNNEVARKSEIASVTGYAPDEWVISNNPYMNDDGTIKDEYKNVDFSAVMAQAKASGNTAAYNAAATARYYKIMGDYGAYGQYDDGNYIVPGQQKTEAGRQFDVNTDVARESLGVKTSDAVEQASMESYYDGQYQTILNLFSPTETRKREFVTEFLKPLIEEAKKGNTFVQVEISDLIQKNTQKYNIDKTDAEHICNILGVSVDWLNSWEDDPNNPYGGMIRKENK